MNIKILGSNSLGNCYILETKTEKLIIEAGIHLDFLKRAVDFDFSKIVGCLISHEHGDHAKYAKDIQNHGIEIFTSQGTADTLGLKCNILKHQKMQNIGDFKVIPFKVFHDAAEPFGFFINHKEIGNLLFITDTNMINASFDKINHLLIETNYDNEILMRNIENEIINMDLANRIYNNHLSLSKALKFVNTLNIRELYSITLIHLSERNSSDKLFKNSFSKYCPNVRIARKGLNYEINNNFF